MKGPPGGINVHPYYIITYVRIDYGVETFGMEAWCGDPVEWLASMQSFSGTHLLLNAQPMTKEQYEAYSGELKGM